MIGSLLDGIVVHAVRGGGTDYLQLESEVRAVRQSICPEISPGDLLVATGTALKALHHYNRKTSASNQAQAVELRQITGMLTEAIVNLAEAGSTNVSRLQLIERHLERAADVEDVRQLKQQLSECLVQLREEKLRQGAASDSVIGGLSNGLRVARAHHEPNMPADAKAESTALDFTTGLRTRPAAEAALSDCIDKRRTAYAALFVVDHLHGVNARFGRAVGDQVITLFTQHLRQKLRPEDTVFRWSGPAFLALLDRDGTLETVRMDLVPVTKARLEKTVEFKGRSVLLPLHFSCNLLAVSPTDRASLLIDKLDSFIAGKVGCEL